MPLNWTRDTGYEVSKNRHKFCGVLESALRGKDEMEGSTKPGIFLGLVDFVAQLDEVFDDHLRNATVFKGTSKTVQNGLLECMLAVAWERIAEEVVSSLSGHPS